jgi:hypothetical protein
VIENNVLIEGVLPSLGNENQKKVLSSSQPQKPNYEWSKMGDFDPVLNAPD